MEENQPEEEELILQKIREILGERFSIWSVSFEDAEGYVYHDYSSRLGGEALGRAMLKNFKAIERCEEYEGVAWDDESDDWEKF